MRPERFPSSSSTASGCSRAAGTAGGPCSRRRATRPSRPAGPTIPRRSTRRTPTPRCSRTRSVGEVADHFEDVIGELTTKPAIIGHSFGGLLTQILAGRGAVARRRSRSTRRRSAACCRCRSRRSSRRRPVLGNPANHGRAVPLTYEQFRYAFANAVDRGRGEGALRRRSPCPAAGAAAVPGRHREPQPVDRGEGEVEEPRPRAAADHLRREGPHRAVGDRQRLVQEAASATRA